MEKIVSAILALLLLTSCSMVRDLLNDSKTAENNFKEFYADGMTLDDFCPGGNKYECSLQIEDTGVELWLEKTDGEWNGDLNLCKRDSKTGYTETVEEIPVSVSDNKIIIHSTEEKEVPITALLCYNFNYEKCNIKNAFVDSNNHPLEEVTGDYPLEDIQQYMKVFYDDIISCLTKFNKKDEYFAAIENLQQFVYIKNNTKSENPLHTLSFGFDGGTNIKQFSPDYSDYKHLTLLLEEKSNRKGDGSLY